MSLPIDTELPILKEGDAAIYLSAEEMNLLARKVNAIANMQAVAPLRLVKSDAGFLITGSRAGLVDDSNLPAGVTPQWIQTQVCIAGVSTDVWVFAGYA